MNGYKGAVALGVAGAIVGLHIYMFMTPRSHKEIQKGLKKVVDEVKELADDIESNIRSMV